MPYFHDGSSSTRDDVIAQKSKLFKIDLEDQDRKALAAYLAVIETGDMPTVPATAERALADIDTGKDGLQFALTHRNAELIAIAADGFARKLQNLADRYDNQLENPDQDRVRTAALSAIADTAIATFQLRSSAEAQHIDRLDIAFQRIIENVEAMRQPVLNAQPYSLFNIDRLKAYRARIGSELP